MKNVKMVVRVLLLVAMCILLPSNAIGKIVSPGRLILSQGNAVLTVYFNGDYQQLVTASAFYGYGWIDEYRVFVAYQEKGNAEAVAVLKVFDLGSKKSVKLTEIGSAGESNFDVSPFTGEIVFCDGDGIKLLRVYKNNEYRIQGLRNGDDFWGAFWLDEKTVGAFVYRNEGSKFVKFPVTP